jgi:hypothetical protein
MMEKLKIKDNMLQYTKDINNEDILLDSNGQQVMMEWEKPYMEACIDFLQPKGDVLEIGFGMGYSATQIQKYNPKSYTIVECDPLVIERCKQWAKDYDNVTIVEGMWQNVLCTENLGKYDEVFFDDFPNNQSRFCTSIANRFYLFMDFLKMFHLNPNAKVSAYLSTDDSMLNDEYFCSKLLSTGEWRYEEKCIKTEVSNIQEYHTSDDSAYIPLLTLL